LRSLSKGPASREEEKARLLVRFRRAEEQWQVVLRTVGKCAFAERIVMGCCERVYRCHSPARGDGLYEPNECSCRCPEFSPREGRTDGTVGRGGS
jgi:hypothetical protein